MSDPVSKTLVVNLFGGPCSGKSTATAGTFYYLKEQGINCEFITEFAKDLVWRECRHLMGNQSWIFGQQHERITALLNKVEVVVVDGPLLHSVIYGQGNDELSNLAIREHRKLNNLNIFLRRNGERKYVQEGRVHTEEESRQIDEDVRSLLRKLEVPTVEIYGKCRDTVPMIVDHALAAIGKVFKDPYGDL